MEEATWVTRVGSIGRPLLLGGMLVVVSACLRPAGALAQAVSPDSAEIYERLANALPDRRGVGVGRNKLNDARRAFALYQQRGDTAGQARALVLVAAEYSEANGKENIDSLVAISRRAVALLRRPAADSSVLAEAVGLLAVGLLKTSAPLDSSARFRAENIRLRNQYPASRKKAQELWAHGEAFVHRAINDSAVFGKSFARDSALWYLHAAVAAARIEADSAWIARSFGDIANIWLLSGRFDSALVYRQRGFSISRVRRSERQMRADLGTIAMIFSVAPLRDRSKGVTRNLDSALVWSRVAFNEMRQFGKESQLRMALTMSDSHQRSGNADSARYYVEVVRLAAARTKDANMETAARTLLVRLYDLAGFTDSSLVILREAVQKSAMLSGPLAKNYQVSSWQSLARSHLTRGALDSAMTWYRAAADTTGLRNSPGGLNSIASEGIAEVHKLRGEPDSAIAAYRQLLVGVDPSNPRAVLRPSAHARRRTAWLGEADILSSLGMVDSAQMLVQRELTAMRKYTMNRATGDSIVPLTALARIFRYRGQLDSALKYDTDVLNTTQDESAFEAEIKARIAVGEDYEALGVLDSARAHYRAAVSMAEYRQMRPRTVLALAALGSWYLSVDAPDSALAIARRAVVTATETASPVLLADARYRLGIIFGALGQSDSAAINLESTLNQRGRPVGPSLVALGNLQLRMGQADTARALLQTALRSYRASGARPAIAQTLTSLSRVEQRLGRPDSALATAAEALLLARATQDRLTEGRALAALGRARFMLGQTDSARRSYEQSLAVFRAAGFTRDARETLAELAELFRVRRSPGDLERATTYFDSAATTFDNARRRTGDDELAVTFAEQQTDIYGGWARAWLGRRTDVGDTRATLAALGAVERGRGQALLQLLQRGAAAAPAALGRAGTDLASEADSLLAAVRQSRSAALSYLHAGDSLFVWFVTPDGKIEVLPARAIAADELNRLISSARRSFAADDARSAELDPDAASDVGDSTASKRDPADDLRRLATLLLPDDLHARVPARTPIIVVPHGAIASVPFAALESRVRSGGTPGTRAGGRASGAPVSADTTTSTLGTRYPLRFAPSFAALRATERRARVLAWGTAPPQAVARAWTATRPAGAAPVLPPAPRTARTLDRTLLAQSLVVGNPTMPFVYSGRSSTRSQLRPLPGAEAESRSIARQLGARVLTGAAATETSVRRRMRSAPIIHLATHGLGYGTAAQARRSYVAFAPDATQDGLLTLGELMDDRTLTLRAELVVLSACQTGLGNLRQAEGTIGLQRAFLAKGARSVLVSLWNVDDAATRLLMEHFYRAWLDPVTPRSKAVALQRAQAAVRHTPGFAHPRYWAAFQLVGAE